MSNHPKAKAAFRWIILSVAFGVLSVGGLLLGLHTPSRAAESLVTVDSYQRIADHTGGFSVTLANDIFGSSVAEVGDLNSDGVIDLAVGASADDTGGNNRGAVYILFLRADGMVSTTQRIADNTGGFVTLWNNANFGSSVAEIGDLNGDGVSDLAIGAPGDNYGGLGGGAVYVLFMKANGEVSSSTKIAHNTGGFGALADNDMFGQSITEISDLNRDGVPDLAVGAIGDDTGGALSERGAVYILFLRADGTVITAQKIADNTGGFGSLSSHDRFGRSVTEISDLNGDGVPDLAVGATGDDTGGADRGAVYILFMKASGTVSATQKIADNTGGFGQLTNLDDFGRSVTGISDLNADSVPDLAVGAIGDDTGGTSRGAVHILFMRTDGTVSATQKIADNTSGFGSLSNYDNFGWSVTEAGDIDGDDKSDLVVGAARDTDDKGAIYVLFLGGPLHTVYLPIVSKDSSEAAIY
jgi:hypothetical protein